MMQNIVENNNFVSFRPSIGDVGSSSVISKPKNRLFNNDPFRFFEFINFNSEITDLNRLLESETRVFIDIIKLYSNYTIDMANLKMKNVYIRRTSENIIDLNVIFVRGVYLDRTKNSVNMNSSYTKNYIYMTNEGGTIYKEGVLIILCDVLEKDFDRIFSIVDNSYEFEKETNLDDLVHINIMKNCFNNIADLVDIIYKSNNIYDSYNSGYNGNHVINFGIDKMTYSQVIAAYYLLKKIVDKHTQANNIIEYEYMKMIIGSMFICEKINKKDKKHIFFQYKLGSDVKEFVKNNKLFFVDKVTEDNKIIFSEESKKELALNDSNKFILGAYEILTKVIRTTPDFFNLTFIEKKIALLGALKGNMII